MFPHTEQTYGKFSTFRILAGIFLDWREHITPGYIKHCTYLLEPLVGAVFSASTPRAATNTIFMNQKKA